MTCVSCDGIGLVADAPCSVCGGAAEPARCGTCGTSVVTDARFCTRCGRPITLDAMSRSPDPGILRSPVPPQLAQRMRLQGGSMIGERKRVTVLFADIEGSTAEISNLDPEEAMAALSPILKILMDAVHAHDGFVNRAHGDGVMALFGAPLANEDHALDACQAALAMREAVRDWGRRRNRGIGLRIGINSGEVIIQSIGSDLSMNYDAVGRTVHLAARMETLARPGSILLTDETWHLVKGRMRASALPAVAVKGFDRPVARHELKTASIVSRWQARQAQGLSAFTGRKPALETLKAAAADAAAGTGRVVVVTALPGIGKSRLAHEFCAVLAGGSAAAALNGAHDAWIVMHAACVPRRNTSSYHPIAPLMRTLIGVTADDGEETIRTRLADFIATRDASLAPLIPAFLSLLDIRSTDPKWARLEPGERRLMVLDAIRAGVASRAAVRPVLIVVEDAHWRDPETQAIIESLSAVASDMRVLLLITQRPEGRVVLPRTAAIRHLDLAPLDHASAAALCQTLLGNDISLMSLSQRVLRLAEGNPLFIEELVKDLKESGKLVGAPGAYRLAGSVEAIRLPDSVHAVIATRIDQLDGPRKSLLQTAAVIGRDVPLPLLAHMLDANPDALAAPLATLVEAGFLASSADPAGGVTYAFAHELTRDVAARALLGETRRRLHAKAIEFIERAYAERLDEHIDRLADHAFEAQLWAKALPYQMRSCRRALRLGANHEAVAICERAFGALAHLPDSPERNKAQVDFTLAAILALEPIGRHRRIAALLREADIKARDLADAWRIAVVNCQLVVALWRIGEHEAALRAARHAETAAKAIGDAALDFAIRHNIGIVHHETGDFAAAIEAFRACLAMETPEIEAKRVGWAALPSVVLRTFLADSLFEMGELAEADRIAEEAAERAEGAGHAYSRVQINQVRARIRIAQGRADAALALLAADWRTSIDLDMVQMHPIIATRLGEAHLAKGDVTAARDILARPSRLDLPLAENAFGWRYLFLARGRADLRGGEVANALVSATQALAMGIERGERPQQAYAHELLGEIALAQRNSALAQQHFENGLRLAEACNMRPLASTIRAHMAPTTGWVSRLRTWGAWFGL